MVLRASVIECDRLLTHLVTCCVVVFPKCCLWLDSGLKNKLFVISSRGLSLVGIVVGVDSHCHTAKGCGPTVTWKPLEKGIHRETTVQGPAGDGRSPVEGREFK